MQISYVYVYKWFLIATVFVDRLFGPKTFYYVQSSIYYSEFAICTAK